MTAADLQFKIRASEWCVNFGDKIYATTKTFKVDRKQFREGYGIMKVNSVGKLKRLRKLHTEKPVYSQNDNGLLCICATFF